jgi:hypothetical protein
MNRCPVARRALLLAAFVSLASCAERAPWVGIGIGAESLGLSWRSRGDYTTIRNTALETSTVQLGLDYRAALRALGEPTALPARSPARGPPYWQSRALRRTSDEAAE